MYFSKEFLIGISFASIGIAGVSFLLSRRKNPTTHGYGMKNMEDFLEDENDKFFDAESKSFRSVSDDEFVSCRTMMSSVESVSFRTVSDMESVSFRTMSDEDSGSFRTMPDENLNGNIKIVKSIGELYMDAVKKQAFEDLQHNFKVVEMNCLELKQAMYTFQQTADDQRLLIDSMKLEMSCLKKDLNRLTSDLLKNTDMQSTETNTEKPDCCKLRRLKTRVSVLESDVTKNSIDIVGINHMLMWLASSGTAAENDVSAGENLFELDTLNEQCHKPTSPTTCASFTPVAGPPPAVTSENVWPPPPPPEVTSENFWPPPPWSHAVTSEHFWLPPPPPAIMFYGFFVTCIFVYITLTG